jgi:hypothetical protein
MGRETALELVVVAAVAALALAANHFLFHWVLLSDGLARGTLF